MKNLKRLMFVLLLPIFTITAMFAANGFEVYFDQTSSTEFELNYILGDHKISETVKNGVTYSEIEFEGSVVTTKNGFAELPFIHASVQLSDDRNVSLEITSTDYVDYKLDYPLLPSRGTIYRNQDPSLIPYEIADESIVDEFYPGDIAQATEPFILRDIRGTNVYVYPFQYNATQNILRVYTNVTVKLTDNNTLPINPITSFSRTIMRDMHNMYSTIFINYDRTRFENELSDSGSILVIHTPRDAAAILPYIEWKREKGHTVYVEEVATGTNVISLVSGQYTAHNDILYVQIVGDWEDISGATMGGDPADPNLGCVVGGDIFMDLIVGRFSANSATHVTTQVNKTITYERDPDMGADWYKAAVGIASNQGPGDDGELDYQHLDVIWNDKLDPFTYDTYTPIYDPSANATMVANAVNTGASIINYCGHGSTTSWVTSGFNNTQVNLLTNGEKLPFITSVACVNGNFDGGECFAEAWLKKDGGGAIGMLASSQNQSWNPPMMGQDYIIDLLIGGYDYSLHPGQNGMTTDVQKTTYGSMCINGTILMAMEDPGTGAIEMAKWHIFGDASLQVRTDTPAEIVLSNNVVLMGIDFTTTITSSGAPIQGVLVCLSQDGNYFSGVTDEFGSVTISHALIAGDAKMVVTAFNTETIYDDVTVIPPGGAYVIFNSYNLDDSSGNGNGELDYGESVLLDLTLNNVGNVQANNVDVTLSTADQYVTILDNSENFGNIPAGQLVTVTGGFSFEVGTDVPDGHGILFDIEATDGTDVWTSSFSIIAYAPVLEFAGFIIDDTAQGNGDYFWDAGETVDIQITIENIGSSDAVDVLGQLFSSDPYITINTAGTLNYGNIEEGTSVEQSFNVTSSPNTPQAHIAAFNFNISAWGGITGTGSFEAQIGGYLIEEHFENWPPTDWQITSSSGQVNWQQGNNNNAGGTPPEAEFYWSPSTTAVQHLISKTVNTTGSSTMELEFKHMVDHYSGNYILRIETTSDGGNTWNIVTSYPASSMAATTELLTIDNNDVGSPTFQIAWVFDGNSYNINSWYIDDVFLTGGGVAPGYITGLITLVGGTGNVEDVIVEAGGTTTNPNPFGGYSLEVIPGTYDVIASLAEYIPQTITGVIVAPGSTTGNIDFTLNSTVDTNIPLIPLVTELTGNYPNPFNPSGAGRSPETTIEFSLHEPSHVKLVIYNIRGQKVRTLIDDELEADYHSVVWDGCDDSRKPVSSGVYFSLFDAANGDYTSTRKMILMK